MNKACPSREVLTRYAHARLADAEAKQIDLHLDDCLDCESIVSGIERLLHAGIRSAIRSTSGQITSQSHLAAIQCDSEIGDCRLLREIGRGSFARVFLALQHSMQRFIAIKISFRASSEPKLLSKLNHPHIVRVYHYDDHNLAEQGLYQLYMEYVSGCSLKQLLDASRSVDWELRSGSFLVKEVERLSLSLGEVGNEDATPSQVISYSWDEAVCWLGARLADALHYAHRQGVIHRDVKPENILLRRSGGPMLLDFNVGFGREIGVGSGDDFGGSWSYMSPEQRQAFEHSRDSNAVTEASDVYSLGVVLDELRTGCRPREQSTVDSHENLSATTQHSIASYRSKSPLAELSTTLGRCLATNPSDRPTTEDLTRRFAILSTPAIRQWLAPQDNHWIRRLANSPVWSTSFAAAVPNLVIALLNIFYNKSHSSIAVNQFEPLVNAIVFPLGFACLVPYTLWVVRATHDDQLLADKQQWNNYASRCLMMGRFFAIIVFSLWLFTGIAFPFLCDFFSEQTVGAYDYLQFFLTQMLYGLFAAAITFFTVTIVAVGALFPQTLWIERCSSTRRILARLEWHLGFHRALLALAPSFSLIALAAFDRNDPSLLAQLGLFGTIGFVIAISLTPVIRSASHAIRLALAPTGQILYSNRIDSDDTI